MRVCRLVLWAFRDREWPVEGADKQDLRGALLCAQGWKEDGLDAFPVDHDIAFKDFIPWAEEILENRS